MRTKETLAQALHHRGLLGLEKAARLGGYDDFESESATPIADLVRDLRAKGAHDLARRAMHGEWDCTTEEADVWANSAEGRKTIAQLPRKP